MCNTQITVTTSDGRKIRNEKTCTSCDPRGKTGYGPTLELKWGKAKAGMCHGFYNGVLVRCTSLDKNEETAAPDEKNVYCSKTGKISDLAAVGKLNSKAARLWFRPLTQKARNSKFKVVARCNMIKHTACRGAHCEVKKSVQCASVCVENGWDGNVSLPKYKNCQAKYCKGKMGALACREIARMA